MPDLQSCLPELLIKFDFKGTLNEGGALTIFWWGAKMGRVAKLRWGTISVPQPCSRPCPPSPLLCLSDYASVCKSFILLINYSLSFTTHSYLGHAF